MQSTLLNHFYFCLFRTLYIRVAPALNTQTTDRSTTSLTTPRSQEFRSSGGKTPHHPTQTLPPRPLANTETATESYLISANEQSRTIRTVRLHIKKYPLPCRMMPKNAESSNQSDCRGTIGTIGREDKWRFEFRVWGRAPIRLHFDSEAVDPVHAIIYSDIPQSPLVTLRCTLC